MMNIVLQAIHEVARYRLAITIGGPVLAVVLAAMGSILTPRGRGKPVITGAYMLMAALGAACLLFAAVALIAGEPADTVVLLFVPGIVLTLVMGIFSPEIIRQYQQFEFRKLEAEIFRRS